ncbi:MAG: hypothetical protein ACQKBU_09180 [Verrucomicrobiales bacterium]
MKPRVTLEQATLPNGSSVILHEHDGRPYLTVDGVQTAGPATRISESELGALACAPFRPARQPKVWIAGLGVGSTLIGVRSTLLQKRASIHVAEPCPPLAWWLRTHLEDSSFLDDPCLTIGHDISANDLLPRKDTLHAILIHSDTAPLLEGNQTLYENHRWMTAAYDSLQAGGLLAIASASPIPDIKKKLERAGFTPSLYEIDAAPNARRPRTHDLWLALKGNYES